ncbi:hypothetical protein DID88_002445 [Monilinia fructigena]|uniref:RecF/RecN/SMC N-terminal domain-containing protein n=1 Tax=Monilinia fructigena TaxID=38457 RepID=A0A395IPD3_9HELO|nr:hypothetical protein DID88_002445 [Monilinia fructigena]
MIGDNHAADNSIIEHIQCVNFMNHQNLNVPLGPLINFVVGMNGSGKSAVLTGITLCLGGKPSATNRGSSMKSLIKSGTERGMLLVKLKNQGPDAYRPEVYGKSIIVERHFSRSGSGSSYKLKNASGNIVSTKKGDMDDIVEYFQLQLKNSNFFRKGVQLEQLDNDYKLVSESCDQIGNLLDESVGDLKGLERQAEEAESKKRIYDQHQDMRVQKRLLRNQLTWCQVDEQESELEERRRKVSETQRKIEEKESILEEKDRAYQSFHFAVERAHEKARVLGEELVPIKEEEQEAKLKADEADSEIKRIHQEHKASQGELKQARIKAQKIQREIEAEQQRIEDANGGSLNRKFAEIEAAKSEASQAKTELERSHQEMQKLTEQSQASKIAVEKEQGPWTAKQKEAEICRNRLREMQKQAPRFDDGQDYVRPYQHGFRMKTDTEGRITLQKETLKQLQEEESKLAKDCYILQQRAEKAERAIQQYKDDPRKNEDSCPEGRGTCRIIGNRTQGAHKAVKKRVELHEKLISDATQKAKAKEQARSLALGEKNAAVTQVEAYKTFKAEAEAKLASQEARVENYIAEATQICARVLVPPSETRASLEAKYKSISEQLQQYSKRLGVTEQEIVDGYVKAHELLKSFKSRRKHMEELLRILKQSFSQPMGAPLRCLDEFDVFMDDVNRDVSTKMIISAARRAVGRQFILITPKALGAGIEVGEDVKIHKLDDPRERNQRSIPEMIGTT